MKTKEILLFILLSICSLELYSQAKKPTIMIVPSMNWCEINGYTSTYNNQGKNQIIPDYEMALIKNSDLKLVIAKINGLMAERGFPLKDLEAVLQSLKTESAEDMMTISKSGSEVAETPVDILKRVAKADIIMELTWTINQRGPFKSVSFILRGLDAYTNKQIAEGVGTGPENGASIIPVLLETAVLAHIDNFNVRLQSHFDDMFENGREVSLRIRRFESFEGDLESEFEGISLSEIIENWMAENTVKGRFSTTDATDNMMLFEQVRIPLFDNKSRPTDTRNWARELSKMLKNSYAIDSKVTMRGLGQATIILGEK